MPGFHSWSENRACSALGHQAPELRFKPLCKLKLRTLQFTRPQPYQPILTAVRVKAGRRRQASSFNIINGKHERTESHTQARQRRYDNQGVIVVVPDICGPPRRRMGLQPLRPRVRPSLRPESKIVAAFERRHQFRLQQRPRRKASMPAVLIQAILSTCRHARADSMWSWPNTTTRV